VVTDKTVVNSSKEPQHASKPQHLVCESFQQRGRWCADEYYRAVTSFTKVLSIWFQQLISADSKTFHYNGNGLLFQPCLTSVPKLDCTSKKVSITLSNEG
jgi:hypothetical protein